MIDMSVDNTTERIGTQFETALDHLKNDIKDLNDFYNFVSENWNGGASKEYLDATKKYTDELTKIKEELLIEQSVISNIYDSYETVDDQLRKDIESIKL